MVSKTFAQSQVVVGTFQAKKGCSVTFIPKEIQSTCPEMLPNNNSENANSNKSNNSQDYPAYNNSNNNNQNQEPNKSANNNVNASEMLTPPASFHFNKKLPASNTYQYNQGNNASNAKSPTTKPVYKWYPKKQPRYNRSLTDSLNGLQTVNTASYSNNTNSNPQPVKKWVKPKPANKHYATITDSLNALQNVDASNYNAANTPPQIRKWVRPKPANKHYATITDSLNALQNVDASNYTNSTNTVATTPKKKWVNPSAYNRPKTVYSPKTNTSAPKNQESSYLTPPIQKKFNKQPTTVYSKPKTYTVGGGTSVSNYEQKPKENVSNEVKIPSANTNQPSYENTSSADNSTSNKNQDYNDQNNTDVSQKSFDNSSSVKPDYKLSVSNDGKCDITFTNGGNSITLSQFGRIISTGTASGNNTQNKYNYRGLLENVGTIPLQYTYEGRVLGVGNIQLNYDYNGNIKSIGGMPISYNYKGSVDKIGNTKVNYNENGNVTGTSNANPIIIMK